MSSPGSCSSTRLRPDHCGLWADVDAGLVDLFVAPSQRVLARALTSVRRVHRRVRAARGPRGDRGPRRARVRRRDEGQGAPPAVDADGRATTAAEPGRRRTRVRPDRGDRLGRARSATTGRDGGGRGGDGRGGAVQRLVAGASRCGRCPRSRCSRSPGILPDFRLQSADGDSATRTAVTAAWGAGAFGLLSALVWPAARAGAAAGARPGARAAGLLPQRLAAADRAAADPRRAGRGRPGDRGRGRRRDVRRRLRDRHRPRRPRRRRLPAPAVPARRPPPRRAAARTAAGRGRPARCSSSSTASGHDVLRDAPAGATGR